MSGPLGSGHKFPGLNQYGLNLQAVLNVADLPAFIRDSIHSSLPDTQAHAQLLLLGHAGRDFWQAFKTSTWGELENSTHADPIDSFTRESVEAWLAETYPDLSYRWLYPVADEYLVDLQALGRTVGWHGDSPFRSGVHPDWGPWYAYRAVLLCERLGEKLSEKLSEPLLDQPSEIPVKTLESPCIRCDSKPCVRACPADALGQTHQAFNLQACLDYRLQTDSPCAHQCIARSACPVGKEHRYSRDQMAYHYGVSLRMIKQWRDSDLSS